MAAAKISQVASAAAMISPIVSRSPPACRTHCELSQANALTSQACSTVNPATVKMTALASQLRIGTYRLARCSRVGDCALSGGAIAKPRRLSPRMAWARARAMTTASTLKAVACATSANPPSARSDAAVAADPAGDRRPVLQQKDHGQQGQDQSDQLQQQRIKRSGNS